MHLFFFIQKNVIINKTGYQRNKVETILSLLNEAQKKAVQDTEGPMIILSGPGSGKTRVITHRIAWLISNGVSPFSILALTFTNRAANEMKERIVKLFNNEKQDVWMGTFHSVFARILRKEADKLGYTTNFTIFDTDDSKRIIKQILKENNLDPQSYPPGFVLNRISNAKMNLISAEKYNNNTEILKLDHEIQKPYIGYIYKLYWNACRRSNAMDFDDLLYNMNILLANFDNVCEYYQKKFNYILVDEYQDTCYSQYKIIKLLSAYHKNICVVGDDAQSIYSFRGARIENIFKFLNDFSETKILKLEQNYRSTKVIVEAANAVISNNRSQLTKTLWTENALGCKIKILINYDETDEAINIAQDIFQTKVNNHEKNADFAVLYRTNAQSRALEEAFRKLNIPYRVYGSLSFYKRKEIKDLLAYFRLIVNENDQEALMRIINIPHRGIGNTTMDRIIIYAHNNDLTLWDVISDIKQIYHKVGINCGVANRIEMFCNFIKSHKIQLEEKNAYEIAESVMEKSNYLDMLKKSSEPDDITRLENLAELLSAIKKYVVNVSEEENTDKQANLRDFLLEISLLTDLDEEIDDKDDRVILMTAHSAKGLEFPYVYISGLEENLFPVKPATGADENIEEERRLFYVALTRAMKKVTLSYAESRYRWGKKEYYEPSRFIFEINQKLIETARKKEIIDWFSGEGINSGIIAKILPKLKITTGIRNRSSHYTKEKSGYADSTDNTLIAPSVVIPGLEVEHEKFGIGKVLKVDGHQADKKAVIFFPAYGKKNLLLRFAKLKMVK